MILSAVSQHVRSTCNSAQPAGHDSLMKFATDLQTDGVWVNESGIVATFDFLQRDIHVHFASDACSPLVYITAQHAAQYDQPILIAFYEPGHYRCVVGQNVVSKIHSMLRTTQSHK